MTLPLIGAFALAMLILVLFIGTIAGLFFVIGGTASRENISRRLQTYAYVPETLQSSYAGFKPDRLQKVRIRLNRVLGTFVSRRLSEQLGSANWPITTSEYALLRIGVSGLLFLLGWLISGQILSGIGIMVIAYIVPNIFLRNAINQRRREFERQLVDILVLMTGAVRAGYSLLQALSVVEQEIRAPASEEISRVTREVELGRSLSEALNGMASRMENDDLQLVVTSININQQVGGNMATMLEAVTATIRERQRLFGEIRSQTSMQRFTGFFLTMLPIIVAALLFVINPSYMSTLFDIMCIPIGAVVGMIMGNLLIRQMLNIKV